MSVKRRTVNGRMISNTIIKDIENVVLKPKSSYRS